VEMSYPSARCSVVCCNLTPVCRRRKNVFMSQDRSWSRFSAADVEAICRHVSPQTREPSPFARSPLPPRALRITRSEQVDGPSPRGSYTGCCYATLQGTVGTQFKQKCELNEYN
jgi:hypothetical protein